MLCLDERMVKKDGNIRTGENAKEKHIKRKKDVKKWSKKKEDK